MKIDPDVYHHCATQSALMSFQVGAMGIIVDVTGTPPQQSFEDVSCCSVALLFSECEDSQVHTQGCSFIQNPLNAFGLLLQATEMFQLLHARRK